jgi:ABC-2 type transport system permease protein
LLDRNGYIAGSGGVYIQQKGRREMKNIWILIKANMKRNFYAVMISVFGAAILCVILNAMGNLVVDVTISKISVGLIDHDQSKLSKDFKDYLADQLDYQVIENYSYERLSTELIEKNISVIIEIPENFYEKYASGSRENIIITSLEDYENAAFIQVYINNYLSSISTLALGAAGDQKTFDQLLDDYDKQDITITQTAAQSIDKEAVAGKAGFIISIGFFLMFIFAISIILAFVVLDDRITGVFNRIQITPVKPVQYIIGSGVFGFLICLVLVSIYCGYIHIAEIQTGIPLWTILFMMSLFALFTVCFSLTVSLALKSKNAVTSIIIGFSTIGCVLGGAYFPLDLAPKSMQNMSRILPQYWFMDAFRRMQENITVNITPNVIILVLFSVLFLLLGAVLFSQNYKNN